MAQYNEPIDIDSLGAPNTYTDPVTARIVSDFYERGLWAGPNSIAVAGEAKGAQTDWLSNVHAVSSVGDKEILISADRNTESIVAGRILKDKDLTRRLLSAAGVPVAEGRAVATAEEAISFQQELGAAVVVKPRFGSRGRGVSVGLTTRQDILEAFQRASQLGEVVVERDLEGVSEYRCLTTPDNCVSVVRRILPWVEGDGVSTVDELIDAKNELRGTIPSSLRRMIPKDAATEATLKRQDLDLSTVLDTGTRVTVREVGGLSSGGEPAEYSDRVPDSVKQVASASARAIPGLGWCGSDIMIDRKGDPYVVEVNTAADTLGAGYPFYGTPASVAPLIFDMRYRHAPNVVKAAPEPPVRRRQPSDAAQLDTKKGGGRSLLSHLRRRLVASGAEIDDVTPMVTKVTFPSGEVQWLAGTATTEDLAAVRGTAQRHSLARRLIRRKGLPLVPGITSLRVDRIDRFRERAPGGTVILTPGRGRWGRKTMRSASTSDEVKDVVGSSRRSWVAQHSVPGERLKVFASPRRSLAIFGEQSPSDSDLRAASDLAVETVRAVPGLRWASVDIVLAPGVAGPNTPMIEGIEFDPWIWNSQMLLSGDIESVFAVILGEDTPADLEELPETAAPNKDHVASPAADPVALAKQRDLPEPDAAETYSILLLGDVHFGESYPTGGARILAKHGYGHATEYLWPFVEAADTTVVNLETPLVDPERDESPFQDVKDYVHWGDKERTIDVLKEMKVSAVSLANNHTLDYGLAGLSSTIKALEGAGIAVFGAGENLRQAKQPFSIAIPESAGGGSVDMYAAFRWRRGYDTRYSYYAGRGKAGAASLSRRSAYRFIPRNPDALNVFYPHWGSDYTWVSPLQQEVARTLVQNGFDLIVGHGAHTIQELELVDGIPVIYGIGNGIFQAGGRFRSYAESRGILPYGFWAMLRISGSPGGRRAHVRLYPVRSDNRVTGFQPNPVGPGEFDRLLAELAPGIQSVRESGCGVTEGMDPLGYYIDVPVVSEAR